MALGGEIFWWLCIAVAIAATAAGVALERWAQQHFFAEDPREFVLDEVAGQALAWAFIAPSAPWWMLIAGFLLFRIFDIWKLGVGWIERLHVPGTIVWDDLLAGVCAGLLSAAFAFALCQ